MQPLVTYWSSPELFLKSKSTSCADTQCSHLPYFIILSAHDDLVGTKGHKLGGGSCGWAVVLGFFKKERNCLLFRKHYVIMGMFFYLGTGDSFKECVLAAHLSGVTRGSWGWPNSSLTPGWVTSEHSWKGTPSPMVLLHAILCPSSDSTELPVCIHRRA